MKYNGRLTLMAIAVFFFLISVILLKDPARKEALILMIAIPAGWILGKQYDKTKYLADPDSLTSVFNRRYAYQLFLKYQEKFSSLSVLVIDIDHFKQLNDQFGHESGDGALKILSGILVKNTRDKGIVCRWGGDEFVVISPQEEEQVKKLVETIKHEVNTCLLRYNIPFITNISIGKAVYPFEGGNLDSLVRKADAKMYKDKKGLDIEFISSETRNQAILV